MTDAEPNPEASPEAESELETDEPKRGGPDRTTLLDRLGSSNLGPRRLAVRTLLRRHGDEPDVLARLAKLLVDDHDETTLTLVARHFGDRPAIAPASVTSALRHLVHEPTTPPRLAHAALLAHDAITLHART